MDTFKEREDVDPFFYDPDAEVEYKYQEYLQEKEEAYNRFIKEYAEKEQNSFTDPWSMKHEQHKSKR